MQLLKDGITKEKEKFLKESEYKKRIQQLEDEKSALMSKIDFETLEKKEIDIEVRSYFLENSDKYPLILATNASNLVSEELLSLKKQNKNMDESDLLEKIGKLADEYEQKIESYEIRKAERFKKTPLFEKIYGLRQEAEKKELLEEKKTTKQEAAKPKQANTAAKDTYDNLVVKKVTPEEAHKIAYQAYIQNLKAKNNSKN